MDFDTRLRTALAGRYEIDREIGHGGMGVVFRAHHLPYESYGRGGRNKWKHTSLS